MKNILNSFEVWGDAQGVKSKLRVKSIDNISLKGIAQLREMILELAIRGKLVSQNPTDESGSELLKKIKHKNEKLFKEGKTKVLKETPEINDNDEPFSLPKGWRWARLTEVCEYSAGKTPSTKNPDFWGTSEDGIPWVNIADIENNGLINESEKFISKEASRKVFSNDPVPAGTILMSFKLTIGKIAILNIAAYHNEAIISITPFEGIVKEYLFIFLPMRARRGHSKNALMGNTLNSTSLSLLMLPIPPSEEQKRIVAKVNELMALCDQLEEQKTKSLKTHQQLVACLLETLAQAANADELQTSWHRLAEYFGVLFCTEDSIEQLKQTILQLAIMGKLVKQDPKDEPARELVNRIVKENNKRKEGKNRKAAMLTPVEHSEKLFDIPKNWIWERLGSISYLQGGFAYDSKTFVSTGDFQVIRMGNIRPDNFRLEENPVYINDALAQKTEDFRIADGDILLTMTGTKDKRDYLYTLVVNSEKLNGKTLFLNQRLCIIRTSINPFFLNLMLKDDRMLDILFAKSTGTANQANIGMTAIANWTLPVPPLNEQERIIKKLNEVFALCDKLTSKIIKSREVQNLLSQTVISSIN